MISAAKPFILLLTILLLFVAVTDALRAQPYDDDDLKLGLALSGIGARYDSEEGLSGFVQIVNFNILGWGERFMPLVRYGDMYKRAGVEIVNDRFFETPLTMHNGFYF